MIKNKKVIESLGNRSIKEIEMLTQNMTDIELGLCATITQHSYLGLLNNYGSHKTKIVRKYRNEFDILNAELQRRLEEQNGSIRGKSLNCLED